MKEISFINLNKNRWSKFEKQLQQKQAISPDDLADNFILLTDDLSYARTFFPKSGIVNYLNSLSAKAHSLIYQSKKEKGSRLIKFWTKELPIALYNARKEFLLSFFIFIASFILGVIGSNMDDNLIRLILGDDYVNNTLDNIARGNPLGVYGQMSPILMFLKISSNNIFVAFLVFLLGVFSPLGTAFILFRNGIMVGSFLAFFFQQALGGVASITIMIHGTLELSAIILAGGAGILLGNSILFPGSYPRKHSFIKGVQNGVRIMLGLVPFFILAAWIESYITRHYHTMSKSIAILIICSSIFIIIAYFVIYPYYLHKKLKPTQNENI